MACEQFNVDSMLNFLDRSVRSVGNARRRSGNLQRRLDSYGDIRDALIELIAESFNVHCAIHFYGSRAIGIGNFRSDLDIYVELNEDYYRGTKPGFQKQIIRFVSEAFRQGSTDFNLQKIPLYNATVPLIFCFYRPRRLRTELTFNNGLGVENSLLIRHLFEIQPRAVNLFHFVRIWLSIGNMRFKNYQTLLLVIFFLQMKGFLPAINEVQQGVHVERITGWKIQFNPERDLHDYGCREMGFSLKRIAQKFFKFYASFNFARHVIISHLGQSVLRQNYANVVARPPGNSGKFNIDKPMAVTSLLTTDYNVTYNVGIDRVRRFTRLCELSAGLIENNF